MLRSSRNLLNSFQAEMSDHGDDNDENNSQMESNNGHEYDGGESANDHGHQALHPALLNVQDIVTVTTRAVIEALRLTGRITPDREAQNGRGETHNTSKHSEIGD